MRVGRGLTTVIDTLGLDAGPPAPPGWTWPGAHRHAVRRRRVRHPGRASAGRATASRAKRIPADVLTAQLRAWPAVRDAAGRPRASTQVLAPAAGPGRGGRRSPGRRGRRGGSATSRPGCGSACTWASSRARRRRRRPRARLREIAVGRRGGRLRRDLRDGPLPADPAGRPGLGRLPGELDDAGLPRRVHRAGAARHAGHRHHLPQRRAPRQDRRHAGRAQRRARGVRARAWPGSPPSTGPTAGRSRRSASGTPCSRTRCGCCRCCGGRAARRSAGGCSTCRRRSCYPRPLQEHVPMLVGGGGERRTLRLAARYADAANVLGDAGRRAAQGRRAARALRSTSAATPPRSR